MIASTPKLAARLMLVALFAIFVFQCKIVDVVVPKF